MNLHVGQRISCGKVKEFESFHWKHAYGQVAWDKEKARFSRIKALIEGIDPRVEARIAGFGADSSEFIAAYPSESGKPDIEVISKEDI